MNTNLTRTPVTVDIYRPGTLPVAQPVGPRWHSYGRRPTHCSMPEPHGLPHPDRTLLLVVEPGGAAPGRRGGTFPQLYLTTPPVPPDPRTAAPYGPARGLAPTVPTPQRPSGGADGPPVLHPDPIYSHFATAAGPSPRDTADTTPPGGARPRTFPIDCAGVGNSRTGTPPRMFIDPRPQLVVYCWSDPTPLPEPPTHPFPQ